MSDSPYETDCQRPDRGGDGRFRPGNRAARGHAAPYAAKAARLRRELFRRVGPKELASIVEALLVAAKGGDVGAARLVLTYTLGEAVPSDIMQQLSELHTAVENLRYELENRASDGPQ